VARRPLIARRGAAALALSLSLFAACGDEPPAEGVTRVVRLEESARVAVRTPWQPPAGALEAGLKPSFARSFDLDSEPHDAILSPIRKVDGAPPPAASRDAAAAKQGGQGLRFARPAGAQIWWLPIRSDAPYLVRVHARKPVRAAGPPLPARCGELAVVEFARPLQGHLPSDATLAALQPLLGAPIAEHRAAAPDDGSWGDCRVSFTTSARAASVLVLLFGGAPDDAAAAPAPAAAEPVDFDELALFELPLARTLPPLADATRRSASPMEREVTIGGETRLAWLAPPPSEVRLALTLPVGRFRLRFGYGVAEEARSSAARTTVRFTAAFETAEGTTPLPLPQAEVAPRTQPTTAGWHDVDVLHVGRGEAATLVLTATSAGDRPTEDLVAFSFPSLVPCARPAGAPRNVVLISIDTLRPDRLGAYGAKRDDGLAISPAIDAFARDAVVFEEARALAPYTLPSHATLLTGLPPAVHGVERFDSSLAAGACARLVDRFREAGCATAAFTGGGFLSPLYGLWRGFDRWTTLDPFFHEQEPMRQLLPRPGEPALNAALWSRTGQAALEQWLDAHRSVPFLLFLHTYAVHNYRPPPDLCERFGVTRNPDKFDPLGESDERTPPASEFPDLRNRYDAAVAGADRAVGRFLDALSARGLDSETIVVLLSDHGEEMGEHGGFGHGRTLYDEVLRVPLIVRVPGLAPRREKQPVSLADVAPTLLSLCGLPGLPAASGRVILPATGERTGPFSAEVNEDHLGELRAIEMGGLKLIEMTRYSPIRPRLPLLALHALPLDARERENLAPLAPDGTPLPLDQQPPEMRQLRAQMDALWRDFATQRLPDERLPGGVRSADLDALGY
jgi:arylsulfatase A-like enzyme